MKLKLYILLISCVFTNKILAQDPIFTQYSLVPETMNSAFTGTFNALNTGVLHRTQWPEGDKRLDTEFAYFNGPIGSFDENSEVPNIGLGFTILNQHEVFTNYNNLLINGVYSLNVDLVDDWGIRFGLETGFGTKNYNFKNLLFEDQIDIDNGSISGGSIDPSLSNLNNKVNYFDISSGFLLENDNFWFGASLKHLNKPNIAFTSEGKTTLDMNLNVQSGYGFRELDGLSSPLPEDSILVLTSNFMMQGEYNRLDLGSMLYFNSFVVGAIAATNPMMKSSRGQLLTSVNLLGSMRIGSVILGYSYDINVTGFGNSQGVHEFSLNWEIGRRCLPCERTRNYLVKRPYGRITG